MTDTPLETRMVDISDKAITRREARAQAEVYLQAATLDAILNGDVPKGDVLTIAQMAGIQGAKRCPDIIPLCHPLLLSGVTVDLRLDRDRNCIVIESWVKVEGKTGVEMEALSAVAAAALTLYDMCKGMDKEIRIDNMVLLEKSGGRSGHYQRGSDG